MKRAPWKPNETINAAKLASRAGRRHLARLLARGLDERFFDELDEEVAQFELLHAGQAVQVEQLRGKTRKLAEVLEEAGRQTNALRQAIKLTFPVNHWARAEFGTAIRTGKLVPYTLKVLQALEHGIENHPAEAQAAHITPADLAAVKRYLKEIPLADGFQESSKDGKKAATAIKNALHLALYGRMNRLRVVAGLALVDDPVAYAEIVNPYPNAPREKNV